MAALLPAAISAAGSIGGGYLAGRSSGQETKMQRTQRKLVDQLIAGLEGAGPFSSLFAADDATFQKSFVDPAKSMFTNQIAPMIQQQSIYGGQQRGTGLDDQLLRAGVDLDQLLNQNLASFQQGAQNRQMSALSGILGSGAGGTSAMSPGQALGQAGAGFLSSDAFGQGIKDIFKQPTQQQAPSPFAVPYQPPRKGFLPDWGVGDQRWSQ